MASTGDLALTVEERGEGQFYWVVLEAANDDSHESQEVMVFRRLRMADEPQPSYSSALAMGATMLRRMES